MVTRSKAILVVSLCLVFAAGAAVGRLSTRAASRQRRGSWLANELNLTRFQQEQLRAIWREAMGKMRQARGEQRRALAGERDRAIRELLSEDQRQAYQQILEDYESKLRALDEHRRATFRQAVARTKEMLTPKQREVYERMIGRMAERRSGRPHEPGARGAYKAQPDQPPQEGPQ